MNMPTKAQPNALLIDTDAQRMQENKMVLSRFFRVQVANDPTDALTLLKKQGYQVAFIDQQLGTDFFSLCYRLFPNVWILPCGSSWADEKVNEIQSVGARLEDIFQYPFDPNDLAEIAQVLGYRNQPEPISPPVQTGHFGGSAAIPSHLQPLGYDPTQYSVQHEISATMAPDQRVQQQSPYLMQNPSTQGTYYSHAPQQQRVPQPLQPVQMFGGYQERAPLVPQAPIIQGTYAFYSPKGGVGKTTVSSNMALALAISQPHLKIALVDFDIFFGNIASFLNLQAYRTVLDWVNAPDEMDEQMVRELLIQHKPSGLWVLPAPTKAIDEEYVTEEVSVRIIGNLKKYFDLVFIDLGPVFRDSTIVAFQYSDKVYLLSDMDRLTLHDCYDMQKEFENMDVPIQKVQWILSNVSGNEGISVKQAKEAMPYPLVGTIPSDPKVKMATNTKDLPMVMALPKSPFSKALLELTSKLFGVSTKLKPQKEKRSIFTFFTRSPKGRVELR